MKVLVKRSIYRNELPEKAAYYDTNHGYKYYDGNKFHSLDDKLIIDYWYEEIELSKLLEKVMPTELISFGSYLLSEIREKRISIEMKRFVNHADIENWKTLKENIGNQ